MRVFGRLRGAAPLPLTPPISDRDGNVYLFRGKQDTVESQVFMGRASGGWEGSCTLDNLGDNLGVHGWIGRTQNEAWLWVGERLAKVSSRTGACSNELANDPSTGSRLKYQAVLPWVRDIPSRTTVVALVQAAADPLPFQVVVDLQNSFFRSGAEFSPKEATNVTVLGVGADSNTGNGFLLVRYVLDGTPMVEGRIIDQEAHTLSVVRLDGGETLPAYSVRGYLQTDSSGKVAGLLSDGSVVMFDRKTGGFHAVRDLSPVGVHAWKGKLWLVGTADNRPVIAPIVDDSVGTPEIWTTSEKAVEQLSQGLSVVDDRISPRRRETWETPVTATGPFPLVHELPPDRYAEDTTGWLIAGPSFAFGGGDRVTSVAFAPLGISYP